MDSRLLTFYKVAKPEWHAVREVAELLLDGREHSPTCTFEKLCQAVTLWNRQIDPLEVAFILGGKKTPSFVVRRHIVEWLKEQIEIIRKREEHTTSASST